MTRQPHSAKPDALWVQLQQLRPMLARHARCQPRQYRGEQFYVLHDQNNARFHKLSTAAYELIAAMNGRRSLAQLLAVARQRLTQEGETELPERAELIELLQYLYVADLLICDIPPSTEALFARQERQRQQRWRQLWSNPLSWRIVLGNPDRLLRRWQPLARALSSKAVGFMWLALVITALVQTLLHWPELRAVSMDALLSPGNLVLLWLTYPALKVVHELGHGLFTKAFGGDVYEYGVVFIVGVPLPYVDASAATGFAAKRQRLMVSAAGMAVELFLAAIAILLWFAVESPSLKAVLLNIALLGSISTLLFNGNPLLKFDGYHLLCDLLETPNLAARAKRQWRYVVERYGYGVTGVRGEARSVPAALGLSGYALASYGYRFFILGVIFFVVAHVSVPLAVGLLGWVLAFQLFWPLFKYIAYLVRGAQLAPNRLRAVSVVVAVSALLWLLLWVVPMPLSTRAEGVVWLPEQSQIRAQASGWIDAMAVAEGQKVPADTPLLTLANPALRSRERLKRAQLKEFQLRYEQFFASDRARANLLREDLAVLKGEAAELERRASQLTLTSPVAGRVYWASRSIEPGYFVPQGELVAYTLGAKSARVRVALTQEEIGAVRQATDGVKARLAGTPERVYTARLLEQVPGGTFRLPSPVLGTQGGGRLPTKTTVDTQVRSVQRVFLMDVALPSEAASAYYGQRVYVRFSHPPEPLIGRWYRYWRQLFIRQLQQ